VGEVVSTVTMFWLLVLAHLTADFLFGSYEMSPTQPVDFSSYCFTHGVITFLATSFALHIYGWRTALFAAGLLTAGHVLLDLLMSLWFFLWSRRHPRKQLGLVTLFVDQFLHCSMLVWVWRLFDRPPSVPVMTFYQIVLPLPTGAFSYDVGAIAIVASGLILVCCVGAIIVRNFLDTIFANVKGFRDSENSTGKYIGILERLLIYILVLTDSLQGVAFLLTAKSITRYKRISEEQGFAEYYLIGTLLSVVWALLIGLGTQAILANRL